MELFERALAILTSMNVLMAWVLVAGIIGYVYSDMQLDGGWGFLADVLLLVIFVLATSLAGATIWSILAGVGK